MAAAKVLLMGRDAAGKSAMKAIIFANYLARETSRLRPTNFVEYNSMKFLQLRLALWECGGQDVFMQHYFGSQKETIFQNTDVLIYVIAAVSDKRGGGCGGQAGSMPGGASDKAKDLNYFALAIESLQQCSPKARAFVLVHKLDLVHESKRDDVLRNYHQDFQNAAPAGTDITYFGTSIWDETLIKAWSKIAYTLVPDIAQLEEQLGHICNVCEANEVVLFEKDTLLLISFASGRTMQEDRFAKIAKIIKGFLRTCDKVRTSVLSWRMVDSSFTATMQPFLPGTFVIVLSKPAIKAGATAENIRAAKRCLAR